MRLFEPYCSQPRDKLVVMHCLGFVCERAAWRWRITLHACMSNKTQRLVIIRRQRNDIVTKINRVGKRAKPKMEAINR